MRKVSSKNIQWLEKELPILKKADVISAETAGRIKSYYRTQTVSGLHWAVIAFAALGSLLIGSGIILLFAHNWDDLSRPARAVLSFCPLIAGALLSTAALLKSDGPALREAAGIFHSLMVGASIALIGQTYHLPGDAPDFMLTWALLALPLQFLLSSTGAYLIYLGLIGGWSVAAQADLGQAAAYWLLLLPALGKLWGMIKVKRHAPDTLISFYGLLIAVLISTGVVFEKTVPGLWIVAYSALLSGIALAGLKLYGSEEGWSNPPKTVGIIGIALLSYLFTWTYFWDDIGWSYVRHSWNYKPWGQTFDISITLVFILIWLAATFSTIRTRTTETLVPAAFPVLGILCFLFGVSGGTSAATASGLIFNGFMLFFGILYIVLGCRNVRLRQLNGGMAVVSLLLITRFFDHRFSFVARGIIFILLGFSFLAANGVILKRKKQQEAVS
ncbi:DUF2157 domain-containing protein [Pontiella agarivorans]|uniref:DUF2157 domain-containing protein n=1 Tax=Pontiella agarivorans TaxID=3038953 RepID=A0ABU5MWC1_9BACT|nr:DUF2157 domain-containing protein [Pontiella agarivorans]MDZ8118412.1 DUF2157 domain-containing protein [Pontiella agarivorans]